MCRPNQIPSWVFSLIATPEIPVVIPRVLESMRHSRVDATNCTLQLNYSLAFLIDYSNENPLTGSLPISIEIIHPLVFAATRKCYKK
jgi:hypothetical protein